MFVMDYGISSYVDQLFSYISYLIVMDTVPITSHISTSGDSRTNSDTDLSIVDMEDEIHPDLSTWTPVERKKLQHMTEFHEAYQRVFGKQASLHTIMKCRISHMNPPIPKSVCEEEMQNVNLDTNKVIIEYITDAQGNRIKILKPLLIKSEPDREYTQNIPSDVDSNISHKQNKIFSCETSFCQNPSWLLPGLRKCCSILFTRQMVYW